MHARQAGRRSLFDRLVEDRTRVLEAADLEECFAVVREQLEPGGRVFGQQRDRATQETRGGRRVPARERAEPG